VFEIWKEMKDMQNLFLQMDADADGLLSESEFVKYYKELFDSEPYRTKLGGRSSDHSKLLFHKKLGGSTTKPINLAQFMSAREAAAPADWRKHMTDEHFNRVSDTWALLLL
jgi:Ca2+-binding EF-hand superfamily protein